MLPKNILSEGNIIAAVVLQHLALDRHHEPKPEGAQNSSCSCRHRKGEISTYKYVSRPPHGRSDFAYVFHAPDTATTNSRLSGAATSVWYFLNRTSDAPHLKTFIGNARTVSSCLCGNLRGAPYADFRNHRLVHPSGMRLGNLSPPFLRPRVSMG